MQGKHTSEHKQSKIVVVTSIVLPLLGLLCELLVDGKILTANSTAAIVAGLISSAIASAGYSSSRAKVKSAEAKAEALKKKSLVFLSKKKGEGADP